MLKFEEGIPIYMQIARQLKLDMLGKRLKGGDKLPSVREIAEEYKVNPNTVQRVFLELEKEALTYTERGIGTFVTRDETRLEDLKTEESERLVRGFTKEMKDFGFQNEEIISIIKTELERRDNECLK